MHVLDKYFRSLKNLAAAGFAVFVLAGCAGTILVSYEFTGKLAIANASGMGQAFEPVAGATVNATSRAGVPASSLVGSTQTSRWEVSFLNSAAEFSVENLLASPITIRVDQALVASNFNPTPVALRAKAFRVRVDSNWVAASDEKNARPQTPVAMPPISMPGNGKAFLSFEPDSTTLFPAGTLFNAQRQFGAAVFTDNGRGSTLTIWIPIESPAGRQTLRFDLQATSANAKLITF